MYRAPSHLKVHHVVEYVFDGNIQEPRLLVTREQRGADATRVLLRCSCKAFVSLEIVNNYMPLGSTQR